MRIIYTSVFALLSILFGARLSAATNQPPKFTGMPSCSSTSCHGGASEEKHQCVIWSRRDFHSRAYATLTSARSERLAEVLKIEDATKSPKCTSCHAPFQTVNEKLLAHGIKITEGVSCESCHGAAEPWLLSHTRPDFNHADRVATGMRDLRNLYVRANTCVACHQRLDADLAQAGHPELIFELDGQAVTQPKHWREREGFSGAKAWYIGQLVALREMSWQLATEPQPDSKLQDRWEGLHWLMKRIDAIEGGNASSGDSDSAPQFGVVQKRADQAAREAASLAWSDDLTRKYLETLATSSEDFRNQEVPGRVQARRAERLVLALDRLAIHSGRTNQTDAELDKLFSLTQSLPDFEPAKFATALEAFARQISR